MKHAKRGFPHLFRGPSDPSRLAVVAFLAGLLCLPALGVAESAFSWEWESLLGYRIATGRWISEIDASVTAALGGLDGSVRVLLEDAVWTKLDLETVTALGPFEIESDLRFEPNKDRFKDWITKLEWRDDAFTLAIISKLTRTTDYLIFDVERKWASVELEADVRLRAPSGGCSLSFYDASVVLGFEWCDVETKLELEVDDDGFDEAMLELSDLVIDSIPWVTLDVEIEWTRQETAIDLSADLALEGVWCGETLTIELEGDLPNAPSLLPVVIQEITIDWEVDPWEIEATVIVDPNETIDDAYWLAIEASGDLGSGLACGDLSIDLIMLWDEAHLGRFGAELSLEPGDDVTVELAFDLSSTGDDDSISLGLHVAW